MIAIENSKKIIDRMKCKKLRSESSPDSNKV